MYGGIFSDAYFKYLNENFIKMYNDLQTGFNDNQTRLVECSRISCKQTLKKLRNFFVQQEAETKYLSVFSLSYLFMKYFLYEYNALKLLKFPTKMHENKPEFHRKIIMSDEAHFHLGGYVNKQDRRILGLENPKMIIEKPFYPQCVTVWCDFWARGIIGPYFFFENEAVAAVLVNRLRYRTMINEFLWPGLEDMDMDDVYFHQDGATCHTSGGTISLLLEKFPGRVISRHGDYN